MLPDPRHVLPDTQHMLPDTCVARDMCCPTLDTCCPTHVRSEGHHRCIFGSHSLRHPLAARPTLRSNILVLDRMETRIGTEKGVKDSKSRKDWGWYERLKVSQRTLELPLLVVHCDFVLFSESLGTKRDLLESLKSLLSVSSDF